MGPLIGEKRRPEGPGRIHAGPGVGNEAKAEPGHGEADPDGRGVGVAGVARIRAGAHHEDQHRRGRELAEEALERRDPGVQEAHAEALGRRRIASVQELLRRYHLKGSVCKV